MPKKQTPCECPLSGYCNRHGVEKNESEYRLCSRDLRYFNLWESRAGGKSSPPVRKQATNFIKSATKHLLHGMKKADEELTNSRMSICLSCSKYDKTKERCMECGCVVPLKAAWLSSSCPDGKW